MKFAEKNNERILPNPLEKNAICPLCKSTVIAKCGDIKMWHWAHKTNKDCDNWGEGESAWHLNWKNNFPEDCQEIIIGEHRADIKIKNIVIEFQNSPISQYEIQERENFYGRMKWVLNGETLAKNFIFYEKKLFFSFKWKWFPKSWLLSEKPIYLDLSFMKFEIMNEIKKYSNNEKHYSNYTEESWEWEDDNGNIRESDYPIYTKYSYNDTKQYLKNLKKKLDIIIEKDIFIIKKLHKNGNGWGKLISKEYFIQENKDGYYRN